jgi:hypothetical protein
MTIKLVWTNPVDLDSMDRLLEMNDEELERTFHKHNTRKPVVVDYMTTAEHVERWFGENSLPLWGGRNV